MVTMAISRRQREKEQRRQHFIDVGQMVFLEKGYERASVEDIARTAEFSKRAVYLYFRDKRDLFHAVVLRGLTRLNDALASAGEPSDRGVDRLVAMGRAYYGFFTSERGFFDLILDFEMRDYHYAKPGEGMTEFGRSCQEMNDRNAELANTAIVKAIDDGADAGGLEPIQVTLLVWGQLIGILQLIAKREDVLEATYGMSAEAFFDRSLAISVAGVFGSGR